jgi:hypothetical protein
MIIEIEFFIRDRQDNERFDADIVLLVIHRQRSTAKSLLSQK